MTGNDMVDMATAAAESNWRRKGFLERIFTPQEQQCIRNALSPDEMVWKLWSMKESTYKVYTRQYGGRFFAPLKFICTGLGASSGRVGIRNKIYHTITIIDKKFIYSIARPGEPGNASFINSFFKIPASDHGKQQQYIHGRMISHFAMVSGKEKEGIQIIKDRNGVPFLYCSQDKRCIPVSITHHGHYAAFTIY